MDKQNIENHIKQQLSNHETPIDTTELWGSIQPKLKKKKRRGIFWLWWGLGALLLVGISTWILLADSRPKWFGQKVETKTLYKQEKQIGDKEILKDEQINGNEQIIELQSVAVSNEKAEILHQESVNHTNESILSYLPKLNIRPINPELPVNFPSLLNATESIETLLGELSYPTRNISSPVLMPKKMPTIKWMIGAESAIYRISKTLSVEDSLMKPYLNQRRQSEKPLEAFSVAVTTTLAHTSGLYFKSGLRYTRINERFQIQESREEIDFIPDGIREIIIDAAGDTTFIRGEVEVRRTFNYLKRTYNQYEMYSLPIQLGYSFRQGKWQFDLEGGIHLNLSTKYQGTIFSNSEGQEFLNLEDPPEPVFQKRLGLGYEAAMSAGYRFTDKWQLNFGGTILIYPKSFTLETYPVQQKYNLLGLRLGIQYFLN